jgi:hypothetical protein
MELPGFPPRCLGTDQAGNNKGCLMIGKSLFLAAVAVAFALLSAPASAAPTGNLAGINTDTSAVEKAHYGRRCWWHRGHWHCRRAYRRYYYGGYYPEYYGYGPSIGFSFGGHRHWGHHHHRHW